MTINVQPKTTLTSKYFVYNSDSRIVEVSRPASSALLSTYAKIESEQIAADNQLFKALDIVDTRKKVVADAKQHVAIATLKVTNAQLSFEASDTAWKNAASNKEIAQSLLTIAESALNAAQKNLALALTEQGQAIKTVNIARQAVE